MAEIFAFLKALPKIVDLLSDINQSLKDLKREAMDKAIDSIKNEYNGKIQALMKAVSDDERKKALLDLYNATHK